MGPIRTSWASAASDASNNNKVLPLPLSGCVCNAFQRKRRISRPSFASGTTVEVGTSPAASSQFWEPRFGDGQSVDDTEMTLPCAEVLFLKPTLILGQFLFLTKKEKETVLQCQFQSARCQGR